MNETLSYAQKRKQMIIKAAIPVFSEKGYRETTMKDIISAAEISRGGLYAHFDNIDDVFLAVLQYTDEQQILPLKQLDDKMSMMDQLSEWVISLVELENRKGASLVRARSEFFFAYSSEMETYLAERRTKLISVIDFFLTEGMMRKELHQGVDKRLFSETMIDFVDGILIREYHVSAPEIMATEKVTFMLQLLEKYLI